MKNKTGILAIAIMLIAAIIIFIFVFSDNGDVNITRDESINNANISANDSGNNDVIISANDSDNDETTMDDSNSNQSTVSNNLSANNNNSVDGKTINEDNENADNSNILDNQMKDFYYTEITDDILARIKGKSYPADDSNIQVSLNELRYCHVLHIGFDGDTHEGEIIVNKAIADDILEIFEELYKRHYPIEKINLVDDYGADDETSMRANNTSAFNYRVVSGSTTLSNHSYGLAIDVNPLYNPYVVTKKDGTTEVQPATASEYVDRYQSNAHFIRKYDDCYNLFVDHGFTWGGDWSTKKDYQHFEKDAR